MSQYISYNSYINNMLKDDELFNNFKQNEIYNNILEHVSEKQGKDYLEYLIRNYYHLIKKLDWNLLLENDKIGNPIKYDYKSILSPHIELESYFISPTTLRYIYTSCDILSNLNKIKNSNDSNESNEPTVIEIGCGYGGQCKILYDISKCFNFKIKSYTLIDLNDANMLQNKYLKSLNYKTNINYISFENLKNNIETNNNEKLLMNAYDLAISNYAIGEFSRDVQIFYIDNVIKRSNHNYIIWNTRPIHPYFSNQIRMLETPQTGNSDDPNIIFLK